MNFPVLLKWTFFCQFFRNFSASLFCKINAFVIFNMVDFSRFLLEIRKKLTNPFQISKINFPVLLKWKFFCQFFNNFSASLFCKINAFVIFNMVDFSRLSLEIRKKLTNPFQISKINCPCFIKMEICLSIF